MSAILEMPAASSEHTRYSPVPSLDQLAILAAETTPILAACAEEGERNRRIADDLIAQIAARGLFKVTQPREFGGYGYTSGASVAVTQHIARGDGATSWIVMNIHAGMWNAGAMSRRARHDVWGKAPDALVCTVTAPRGIGRPAQGGRLLNGLWPFASGCLHADWVTLGVMLVDANGAMQGLNIALVPIADVRIRDDWDASGFRGTGSNTLELTDVFVPEHRLASLDALIEGHSCFEDADASSAYYGTALSGLFAAVVFGPIIGLGEAACDIFISGLAGREVAYSLGAMQEDSQIIQLHLALTRMAIETTRLLAAQINEALDKSAAARTPLDEAMRARIRASVSYAARQVLESVQLLMADSGGRGLSGALPRVLRDLQALNNHGIVNSFQTLAAWGATLLGRPTAVVLR